MGYSGVNKTVHHVDRKGTEVWHLCIIGNQYHYIRGASAALIVYDITSADTFEQARSWINELKAVSRADVIIGNYQFYAALAGNKVDLERNRSVDIETAQNFAKLNNCLFMETSAKTGHNVQEMFMKIANLLPRDNNPTLESVHVGILII